MTEAVLVTGGAGYIGLHTVLVNPLLIQLAFTLPAHGRFGDALRAVRAILQARREARAGRGLAQAVSASEG